MTDERKDIGQFSDRGYRQLFSHPALVEGLIRSFVHEDFVADIDFSTLQKNDTLLLMNFHRRESDLVWQVQTRTGPAFIYLLLEFKSTSHRYVALQVLHYVLMFYWGLLRQKRNHQKARRAILEARPRKRKRAAPIGRGFRLPLVFPIVLYSGEKPWTAPASLAELIEPLRDSLQGYAPGFKYYRIAVNEIPLERLMQLDSVVAKLFLVETCKKLPPDGPDLTVAITAICDILRQRDNFELKEDVRDWMVERLRQNGMPLDRRILDTLEVAPMLDTSFKQLRETEREAGRTEGKIEGKLEGKIDILLAQVKARFDTADEATLNRIRSMSDTAKLQDLSVALIQASDWLDFLSALNKAAPSQTTSFGMVP